MPTQSIIVGVDLAPIKPVPRVITFQSDITTDKCRATIRSHVKHWKADTVLHDGAPNVGTAWVQDAFSQAELVLESLRLATDFLAEGGTFVTKIFRSKDYNPLLWVFKQLFSSVEATKPPSSRNVSAEIFVVCRGYKAPKRIDPKFLDPKHVFAELADPTPNNEAKVFNPEKKKRKREGYEEGDYTQYKEIPVTEFINTTDPIAILGSYNKLSFVQPPGGDLALSTLNRLEETTDEIRECCEDLKVLGKKEFRNLLKWRLKLREKFGLIVKKKQQQQDDNDGEEVAEIAPMDEELAIQEDLQRMREQESTRDKKERRKENEKKRKEIVRMQMHMTTPVDIGMEQIGPGGEDATFSLKRVDRANARDAVVNAREVPVESESEEESEEEDEDSDAEEDRLERELDTMYERYQDRMEDKDSKLRAKKSRKDYQTEEWEGFSEDNKSDDSDQEDEDSKPAASSAAAPVSGGISNNAAMFFDQDIFQGLGAEEEEEEEDEDEDDDDDADDKEDEGEDSDEMDEEEDIPAPAPKTKKDTKKKESEWVDDSDAEPEEPEEPRKPNGQLGKLCRDPDKMRPTRLTFVLQTSISSPRRLWPLLIKWPRAKRSPAMSPMMGSTAFHSAMWTVFPTGSSTTRASTARFSARSPRPLRPLSRRRCGPSTHAPSRR